MTTLKTDPNYKSSKWFNFSERAVGYLIGMIVIMSALLSILRQQAVDWYPFLEIIVFCIIMAILGCFIRVSLQRSRIALLTISLAIYLAFSIIMALFISLLFPIWFIPIDITLIQIDSFIGYSWSEYVISFAEYPHISIGLSYVYNSSILQLLCVIFLFAAMNEVTKMQLFLLTGSFSLLLTTLFWVFFPSFGPSAYQEIPLEVSQEIGVLVNNAYGTWLLNLAQNGVAVISLDEVPSAIAFPSYHTVMACIVVWFLRKTHFFIPALIINLLMLPAILLHGGHHFIDIIGGFITFLISARLAVLVLSYDPIKEHNIAPS